MEKPKTLRELRSEQNILMELLTKGESKMGVDELEKICRHETTSNPYGHFDGDGDASVSSLNIIHQTLNQALAIKSTDKLIKITWELHKAELAEVQRLMAAGKEQ